MKTTEQILEKINKHKDDFLDYTTSDLVPYLDFDIAKQFFDEIYLKEIESGEEVWEVSTKSPEEMIKEYMPFAWRKANNCRGLSAGRYISHFSSWLWLDGKDELSEEIKEYTYYGKPQLVKICELYGIDWKQYDDDCWVMSEDDSPITAEQALTRG